MRPFGDAPDDARQGMLCFGAACEISVDCSEGIDSLIASGHTVLCVRGKVTDRNAETEYRQSELCTISAEGGLTPVQPRDGEVCFLQGSTGPLRIVCEVEAGGRRIITKKKMPLASQVFPRLFEKAAAKQVRSHVRETRILCSVSSDGNRGLFCMPAPVSFKDHPLPNAAPSRRMSSISPVPAFTYTVKSSMLFV